MYNIGIFFKQKKAKNKENIRKIIYRNLNKEYIFKYWGFKT